jgi:hypothetical protein
MKSKYEIRTGLLRRFAPYNDVQCNHLPCECH